MYPVTLTLLMSGIVQGWLWLLLTIMLYVSSHPYIVDVWYCSGLVMVIINHNTHYNTGYGYY